MTASIEQQTTRGVRSWPVHWLAVLLTGLALFGAVLTVLLNTGDPVYLPSLLLLGAAVVPATLTTFITEFQPVPRLSLARILTVAVLGGVVGGVLAGQLEFDTARTLGSLPYPMIGLIEESAKLAIPVVLFAWRRPRPRPLDGLVLGVAVGSGFAAVETMGYAFVALLKSGGHPQPVESLLLVRALGSLGGHAAWTGLACAALFAIPAARRRWLGWLRFLGAFMGVVYLHAQWDASAAHHGDLAVGTASFGLLLLAAWWLRRHDRQPLQLPPPPLSGAAGGELSAGGEVATKAGGHPSAALRLLGVG